MFPNRKEADRYYENPIARLFGSLSREGGTMALNIAFKYKVLGCDRCRFANRALLSEKAERERTDPCTRQGKRELGKQGRCLNRQKPIAF